MWSALVSLLAPPLCVACGADAGAAGALCRDCRAFLARSAQHGWVSPAAAQPATRCWTAFAYDGPAGALVRALKFGGRAGLADVMAAQIAAHAPAELLSAALVPVPVHPSHRRRRGLDHARLLAAALACRSGSELADCLQRGGAARAQVGRGRAERLRGPAGSVGVKASVQVPRRALIVDDVVTTGATIAACAAALRAAGCREICAICYARTTAR